MAKSSALTVRLPEPLKARLEARARAEHRSLSAQVVADLERGAEDEPGTPAGPGSFLGLYEGTRLPTDADLAEVRGRLWGRLARGLEG